ncbi:MAG TPA: GNAT family N-acetyltransferase [Spirochaetota bacterium]|nr:GNAT family N-acetyltransferase [Spirochaetota bacterium]HPI21867.1 GNAT family N-acetyltransferase [Spirochaetota bacterium]HPU87676.1 GNAT family N-acetyltransferase [Spirochaetota bacterium]
MIEIVPLARLPHLAEVLGGWAYGEWYAHRDVPRAAVIESYRHRAHSRNELPIAWVALEDGRPAGMASLKPDDLWSRRDLGPWLASLYVDPHRRNRGVATRLVETVVAAARDLSFPRIFLFRSHEWLDDFYRNRGWSLYGDCVDNDGRPAKIYLMQLAPPTV